MYVSASQCVCASVRLSVCTSVGECEGLCVRVCVLPLIDNTTTLWVYVRLRACARACVRACACDNVCRDYITN